MKNFWTAQDIENLAAQGKRELVIDDTAVLTDLARHMADQLGIAVVNRAQTASAAPPVPTSSGASSAPRAATVVKLHGKPKGCQHGPLTGQAPAATTPVSNPTPPSANSNPVVDQLVGLVKRLGGK